MNLNHAELLHTTSLFLYVRPQSHHIISPLFSPSVRPLLSLILGHLHVCSFFMPCPLHFFVFFFVTLSFSPSLSPYRLSPTITCSPSLLHQEEIQWVTPRLSRYIFLLFFLSLLGMFISGRRSSLLISLIKLISCWFNQLQHKSV